MRRIKTEDRRQLESCELAAAPWIARPHPPTTGEAGWNDSEPKFNLTRSEMRLFLVLSSEETPAGSSSDQPLAGIRSETFHRIVGNG
jgi:hypothetical protein